jgi:gamma-glutamylcyclotransferase (GGCT)/AIG2-like uncharacterized protein YtfP
MTLKTKHVQFLFVYGSLMRGTSPDIHPLLALHAEYVCSAMLQGRLYRVDYYPGAVKTQAVSDRVHGELYRLLEPGDLLARLDQYEECAPEFPEPTEYVRCKESVIIDYGDSVRAWIYLYNWPLTKLERIESGDFRR